MHCFQRENTESRVNKNVRNYCIYRASLYKFVCRPILAVKKIELGKVIQSEFNLSRGRVGVIIITN